MQKKNQRLFVAEENEVEQEEYEEPWTWQERLI